MTKLVMLKPIYLAFLVVLTYFVILIKSWVVILLALLALIALFRQYSKKAIIQTIIILTLFVAYFTFLGNKQIQLEKQLPSQVSTLRVIPDSISVDGDLLSARAEEGKQRYQLYYQLQTELEKEYFQNLNQLILLKVMASVEKPQGQRNFKGFDYKTYLKREGIYGIVQVEKVNAIHLVAPQNPEEWVRLWRRKLLVHINQHFPEPMKHYMTGLLLGYLDKSFDEMSDIYTDLGIIHLFALSGMQVGFFVGIFRTILLRLGLLREHFLL